MFAPALAIADDHQAAGAVSAQQIVEMDGGLVKRAAEYFDTKRLLG